LRMVVNGLVIPELLQVMLAAGRWPRTADEAQKQNLRSLVPADRNRRLASIYFYAPPFHTVAQIVAKDDFYARFGALHELTPEAAIQIGDFGLGSDSPILLDYRNGVTDPRVLYLEWTDAGKPNYWVEMAPDFPSFVELLGL
jgi:hypothetical protein